LRSLQVGLGLLSTLPFGTTTSTNISLGNQGFQQSLISASDLLQSAEREKQEAAITGLLLEIAAAYLKVQLSTASPMYSSSEKGDVAALLAANSSNQNLATNAQTQAYLRGGLKPAF
jgi:hypothetical protein